MIMNMMMLLFVNCFGCFKFTMLMIVSSA